VVQSERSGKRVVQSESQANEWVQSESQANEWFSPRVRGHISVCERVPYGPSASETEMCERETKPRESSLMKEQTQEKSSHPPGTESCVATGQPIRRSVDREVTGRNRKVKQLSPENSIAGVEALHVAADSMTRSGTGKLRASPRDRRARQGANGFAQEPRRPNRLLDRTRAGETRRPNSESRAPEGASPGR